jgi:hypothetical protein
VAGRNDPHKGGKKNSAADQEQDEDVEVESKEPERDRRQDQLGNQAVAAMISSGFGAADGGAGGGGGAMAMRQADEREQEGVDYGGDDDPEPADVRFEEALFAEAWKPRTKKSEQKARFAESMPDDDLPPEDGAWVRAVRAAPAPRVQASSGVEALVQPSTEVVSTSLTEWMGRAFEWGTRSIVWRCLEHAVLPTAPGLVDPHGRVLPSRVRGGAIAVAALLDSPTLRADADPTTGALLLMDLELRARRRRMVAHADAAIALFENSLPYALALFEARAPRATARLRPRNPSDHAVHTMLEALQTLLDLVDPVGLLPVLSEEEEEEDDDPLGLQAILDENAGGKPPPAHQEAAIKAAERLAEQAAIGRVQAAAAAAVVAEVADLWIAGPPRAALASTLATHDERVQETLTLLVDIARAAKMGQVGAIGLGRGLKRAAKAMRQHRHELSHSMARAAASVLPEGAIVAPLQQVPEDPLWESWADGRPLMAIPWLQATLEGWERDTAIALTRLAAGQLQAADTLSALASDAPPALADPLQILRDAALLQEGRTGEVDPSSRGARGLSSRNGLLVAEAALTTMEALVAQGDLAAAEAHRATVGTQLYHLGSQSGFSLLARWSPPDPTDE